MNASATAQNAALPLALGDCAADPLPPRRSAQPLPSPAVLRQRLPLSDTLAARIQTDRNAIRAVLDGHDPRLLVVVGPCSLHDPAAALEYAERLAELARELDDQLLLVMRTYVEKPRTTVGWKGLVYDPHLDGSGDMAEGLRLSRRLMLDILACGLADRQRTAATAGRRLLRRSAGLGRHRCAHQRVADSPRTGQWSGSAGGLQERHRRQPGHRL